MKITNLKAIILAFVAAMFLSIGTVSMAQQSSGEDINSTIREVEKSTGGKVLSADKVRENGELRYRLKVLTPEGKVRIITRNPG